ncbi:hypothetical protein MTO96_042052 [Rhipicephalus appendiculatus]
MGPRLASVHRRGGPECHAGEGRRYCCSTYSVRRDWTRTTRLLTSRLEVDANQGTGAGAASDAYQQALAVLDAYFAPPEDAVCVRAQFRRRVQHSEETAVQYFMELRRLADACSFGTAATTMVRDQLLHGLQDAHLARTFIRMGDAFTVQKALELAKQEERVERTMQQLTIQVNVVTRRKHGCIHLSCQPRLCPLRGSAVVLGLWHRDMFHQYLTFMYALRKVAPQASGRGLPKGGEFTGQLSSSCSTGLLRATAVPTGFVEMAPVQASAP